MTQLQMLGFGLLIFAGAMALANHNLKNQDTMRLKNFPQVFTRRSHPGLFELFEKTSAALSPLCVILGIVFLLIRP